VFLHIGEASTQIGVTEKDVSFSEGYNCLGNESVPRYGSKWLSTISYMALYHEISHAIEIVNKHPERLALNYFGMSVKTQVEVAGNFYDQPVTTQATERECRVNAIQAKLMAFVFNMSELDVLDEVIKSSADALYLMGDHLNICVPKNITVFEEKALYRKEWVRQKVREYHKGLLIDDILKDLLKIKSLRLKLQK
jgi:hypothetical protein